jgi:hypothetical protein
MQAALAVLDARKQLDNMRVFSKIIAVADESKVTWIKLN